jgi:D-alanyl-lipoteichoic acid acyltransferase DltB (MBOAT superfamily)
LAIPYFDVGFWVVVALVAAALRVTRRKLLAFGIWNSLALYIMTDLQTVLAAAAFTMTAWLVLWMVLRLRALACEAQAQARQAMLVAAVSNSGGVTTFPSRGIEGGGELLYRAAALSRLAALAAILALAFPVFLFIFYKLTLEYKAVGDWLKASDLASLQILAKGSRWLVFSYVVLRFVETMHAVLWKNLRLLDPLSLMGYFVPFHMLYCGPVNRYDEHLRWEDFAARPQTANAWLLGLNDVTTGLFYKFVVAEYWRQFFFGSGPLGSTSWWDTALVVVYLFFDFAGYSSIALGVGRWLSVPTPVNFRSPFQATTVTDFFTRWHISLGSFVLRNIYTPIQLALTRRWGIKNAWRAGIIALLAGWLFVGLWHRLSWAFLAYGVGMGVLVWTEKWVRDRLLKKTWARSQTARRVLQALGPVYVFVAVTTAIHFVIREIF